MCLLYKIAYRSLCYDNLYREINYFNKGSAVAKLLRERRENRNGIRNQVA